MSAPSAGCGPVDLFCILSLKAPCCVAAHGIHTAVTVVDIPWHPLPPHMSPPSFILPSLTLDDQLLFLLLLLLTLTLLLHWSSRAITFYSILEQDFIRS